MSTLVYLAKKSLSYEFFPKIFVHKLLLGLQEAHLLLRPFTGLVLLVLIGVFLMLNAVGLVFKKILISCK